MQFYFGNKVIEKYQDKEKIDKNASIQKGIDDAKIEVKQNITKMVDNFEVIKSSTNHWIIKIPF